MPEDTNEHIFSLCPLGDTDVEEYSHLLRSLSNYQVPQNPKGNEEWLRNRLEFDEITRNRRHYVAVHISTNEPVVVILASTNGLPIRANTCLLISLVP